MKIKLIVIGKTDEEYLITGIDKYISRLKHYIEFEIIVIPNIKTKGKVINKLRKVAEGVEILKHVSKSDFMVLLDEQGKEFSSEEFSHFIQKRLNSGMDLTYVIGGPFGFSEELEELNDQLTMKIALSKMTFSHQMVRLLFIEQLYRSFTILKGEKYHHS